MVRRGETWSVEQRAAWDARMAERTRKCKRCGLESSDLTLYVPSKISLYGVQNLCRVCNRAKTATDKRAVRDRLTDVKRSPCVDCGQTFPPECMDFDHVRGEKSFNLGSASALGQRWETLEVEIAKCDLVCANCHRIRTTERRKASK